MSEAGLQLGQKTSETHTNGVVEPHDNRYELSLSSLPPLLQLSTLITFLGYLPECRFVFHQSLSIDYGSALLLPSTTPLSPPPLFRQAK